MYVNYVKVCHNLLKMYELCKVYVNYVKVCVNCVIACE